VVNRLGMDHAGTVRAIQTANWLKPDDIADEAYLAAARHWDRERGAYAHVQATRPPYGRRSARTAAEVTRRRRACRR
jgi:hypothetical protein